MTMPDGSPRMAHPSVALAFSHPTDRVMASPSSHTGLRSSPLPDPSQPSSLQAYPASFSGLSVIDISFFIFNSSICFNRNTCNTTPLCPIPRIELTCFWPFYGFHSLIHKVQ